MERTILKDLLKWKNSPHRKPLILRGARQVGKTWILKEFGKTYSAPAAYFNFDEHEEYKQFFKTTKDVDRILQNLAMASGQRISKDGLIIFDEIQECEEALNTLKYFCENAGQYHVACAGSLLGLTLSKGFPVGKVDFLDMYPMTFTEFLMADKEQRYVDYLDSLEGIQEIPEAFFNPLIEKLKMYFVTGGMPEAVLYWVEEHDVNETEKALSGIIGSYEKDFGKHPEAVTVPKIMHIWTSLPSQLSRENKKFMYSVVKEGARAREYEDALNWICNSDIANKIYRCTKPGLPLSAYDDLSAFKIYMTDVGVLRRMSHLSPTVFGDGNRLFSEFKGALTENYILQSIKAQFEVVPRYWSDGKHEVDFVIQKENNIIPVEVKAGESVGASSLKKYGEKYGDTTPVMIRFSTKNLRLDGNVLNIPLFMADWLDRILDLSPSCRQIVGGG